MDSLKIGLPPRDWGKTNKTKVEESKQPDLFDIFGGTDTNVAAAQSKPVTSNTLDDLLNSLSISNPPNSQSRAPNAGIS